MLKMDELAKTANTDISATWRTKSAEVVSLNKILSIDDSGASVRDALNKVMQYFDVAETLRSVKASAEYVVQIPAQFQERYEAGEYFMMENMKNGNMWPNLMEIAEDGRNHIVTPLQVKKRGFIQGNPVQEIARSYQNLYMQQQLQQMSLLMEKALSKLEQIAKGQERDRTALLESGREQIYLALHGKDGSEKQHAIQLGRQSLSDGKYQILGALRQDIEDFRPIPKQYLVRQAILWVNKNYLNDKDDQFEKIEENYKLFLQATKMQAASYLLEGDEDTANRVFEMSLKELNKIDFQSLATIRYSHKDRFEGFFDYMTETLQLEKQSCFDVAKQKECLLISMSGEELLEVIENGAAESEETEKIES